MNGHGEFELDKDSQFCVFEQDVQGLSDESLLGYLNDVIGSKEKSLGKLVEIASADLKIFVHDLTPDIQETISPTSKDLSSCF